MITTSKVFLPMPLAPTEIASLLLAGVEKKDLLVWTQGNIGLILPLVHFGFLEAAEKQATAWLESLEWFGLRRPGPKGEAAPVSEAAWGKLANYRTPKRANIKRQRTSPDLKGQIWRRARELG